MIELVLRQADVAQIRFAHSPLQELAGSVITLQDAARQPMHRRWLRWAEPRLRGHCFDLLFALMPVDRYSPDFLTPTCGSGTLEFVDELDAVRATPAEQVRAELAEMTVLPAAARDLYEDPSRHLGRVVDQLRAYWRLVLEPVWPRISALTADDVGYRLQQCADEGIGRVLNSVSGRVAFHGDVLVVDKRYTCRHDLGGAGLLLVPCVFVWPTVAVTCCGAAQPSITYPPRGLGTAWERRGDRGPEPLGALVGRTRAAMLDVLGLPVTTTQLAARLGISAAAASQHLQILKAAALVQSRRQGRLVLYQRTPAGTVLHDAARRQHLDSLPAGLAG